MKVLTPTLILAFLSINLFAQDYEARKQQYIDSVITNDYVNAIVIQAFNDDPVNQQRLDEIYDQFTTRSTIDFVLVELVRVMYLSDGSYDQQIVAQLETLPYWINDGDTLHNYWTENHQIMWGSTEWLMHERFGWEVNDNLRKRLVHYLNLKLEVGFHEFFSSTYFPFTLSGLMNLADFAEDEELRTKAEAVARELLRKFILVCNTDGAYYPAAGRNFPGRYVSPYSGNHGAIIYLISGRGRCPSENADRADFIATSSIDFSDLENEFVSQMDTIYSFGYTPEEALIKHDSLYYVDRLMMHWSGGMYFHPYIAEETGALLTDSSMWGHVDFTDFSLISSLPVTQWEAISIELDELTVSRSDVGADIAIYKNDEIVLASIQDYWRGKIGFQQWPIAANVGGTCVYTASGLVESDWNERNTSNFNEHLPYIEQDGNVALVMYRPQSVSPVLPFINKDVALHWRDQDFESTDEDGNWIFGKNGENYIGVRRACVGEINGIRACETNGGQTWVFILGNDNLYGSYSAFQNLVGQSTFNEEWIPDGNGDSTYYASIDIDGRAIEYYWGPNEDFTSINETKPEQLVMYPNPANDFVSIQIPSEVGDNASVQLFDLAGNLVHRQSVSASSLARVDVSSLASGTYMVQLVGTKAVRTSKLMKTN